MLRLSPAASLRKDSLLPVKYRKVHVVRIYLPSHLGVTSSLGLCLYEAQKAWKWDRNTGRAAAL